jgi:hypothetical protein
MPQAFRQGGVISATASPTRAPTAGVRSSPLQQAPLTAAPQRPLRCAAAREPARTTPAAAVRVGTTSRGSRSISMRLFGKKKAGEAAAGPSTSRVAARATTVSVRAHTAVGCWRWLAAVTHCYVSVWRAARCPMPLSVRACIAHASITPRQPPCPSPQCTTPAAHPRACQREPMTQAEVEDLVLQLNKIGVRVHGGGGGGRVS